MPFTFSKPVLVTSRALRMETYVAIILMENVVVNLLLLAPNVTVVEMVIGVLENKPKLVVEVRISFSISSK